MNQIFKNNPYRLLEAFMDAPTKEFSVRGLARQLNISHATVIRHLTELKKQKLVKINDKTLYPLYRANRENRTYQQYKINKTVLELEESGIIDKIEETCLPSSIVLFGSCARGEDTERSDIDIFVEAEDNSFNIEKIGKKLGKPINILFESNINSLSKELRNSIVDGLVLRGTLNIL